MNLNQNYLKAFLFASFLIVGCTSLLIPQPQFSEAKNLPSKNTSPLSEKAAAEPVAKPQKNSARIKQQEIADEVSKVIELVPAPGMGFDLVMGMIEQESSFNPSVTNFEENAYPAIRRTAKSEKKAKSLSTSYGLTQVLGATAAQYGVSELELKKDWKLQIHLGALELGKCLHKEAGNRKKALACYNAGRGKKVYPPGAYLHASRVLKRVAKFS